MNDGPPVRFSERFRAILDRRTDISLQGLARYTGFGASTFSRILSGEHEASPELLKCLAQAFDLPLGDLVAGTDAEARLSTPPKAAGNPYFQEAKGTIYGQEHKVHDLEAQIRTLKDDVQRERKARELAEQQRGEALGSVELLAKELAVLTKRFDARAGEIARALELLQRAARAVAHLQTESAALEEKLGKSLWRAAASTGTLEFLAAFNAACNDSFARLFDIQSLFETDSKADWPVINVPESLKSSRKNKK